jgi:hypothetical protein
MRGNMFGPLHKLGLVSHIRHGNFGAVCTPHVNWDLDTQTSAVDRCRDVFADHHDPQLKGFDAAIMVLLHRLFFEPAIARERLRQLANRWASAGMSHLFLFVESVTDLSPLAGLTGLTELGLHSTGVTDLAPLAGLTRLRRLYLGHTQVSDLSPLAELTTLRYLDLDEAWS